MLVPEVNGPGFYGDYMLVSYDRSIVSLSTLQELIFWTMERLTLDKEWMSRLSRRIYDGKAIILGDDVGTGEQDLIFIFSSPPTSYLLPGCNLHDSTD